MSKIIESPVGVFPGFVTLPEFLTLPQVQQFERAMYEIRVLAARLKGDIENGIDPDQSIVDSDFDAVTLPAVCSIIESWDLKYNGEPLEQPSPNSFPGSPRVAAGELLKWLIDEISDLYSPEIPNP